MSNSLLLPDIVGVIASFLPSTTNSQRPLMLVCSTWFDGVVAQNGMQPMPHVRWPWVALRQRQPKNVRLLPNGTDDDIASLAANLPYVQGVNLKNQQQITPVGLKHVIRLNGLVRLNLTGWDRRAPEVLHSVVQSHATTLNILDISGCHSAMPPLLKCAEFFSQMEALSSLSIGGLECKMEWIEAVSQLPHVEKLSIGLGNKKKKEDEDGEMMAMIAKMQPLRSLELHGVFAESEAFMLELANMKCLRRLSLKRLLWQNLSKTAFQRLLTELDSLLELSIQVKGFDERDWWDFKMNQPTQITHLHLTKVPISVNALVHNFPHVQALELSDCGFGPDALTLLSSLVHLRSLTWCRMPFDGYARIPTAKLHLDHLALLDCDSLQEDTVGLMVALEDLKSLEITRCFKDTPLTFLRHLEAVEELKLIGYHFQHDDGLALIDLKNLRSLSLAYCRYVTDDTVRELVRHCRLLTSLSVEGCTDVSDASLTFIANHSNSIEELVLDACNVTDVGLRDLQRSPTLKVAHVSDCDISEEAFEEASTYFEVVCLTL